MTRSAVRVAAGMVAVVVLTLAGACDRDDRGDRGDRDERRGETSAPTTTAGSGCGRGVAPGRTTHTITSAGVERTYQLYVPRSATGEQANRVVFDLHGHGSNATQQLAYSSIEPIAERDGWVVIAPEGAGNPQAFDLAGTSDVELFDAIVDDVAKTVCVDRERVFTMGMSNGGAMSSILGCRGAGRYKAVAAVAAIVYVDAFCADAPPVPIVAFAGTADPVVPFDGGRVNCCGNPTIGSAPEAMTKWAQHNGCDPTPSEERIGSDVVRRSWSGCKAATVFYVVEGGGHTWPGAIAINRLGPTTSSVRATERILEFFAS